MVAEGILIRSGQRQHRGSWLRGRRVKIALAGVAERGRGFRISILLSLTSLSTTTVLLAQLRDRGDPGSNPALIHTAVFIPRSASRKAIGPEVKW